MGSIHSRHAMLLLPIIVGVCSVAPFDYPSFNHGSRDSVLGMQIYMHTMCFSNTLDDDHVNPAVCTKLRFLLETMSPEIIPAAVIAGDASILREYLTKCPHEVASYLCIHCVNLIPRPPSCFPHFSILQATKSLVEARE